MNIEYSKPLSNAWDRMKKALFQPFDIGKWFVLGFTAFLAQLLNGGGGGSNFVGGGGRSDNKDIEFPDIWRFPDIAADWIHAHLFFALLILAGILIAIGVLLVLTWLSSRGAFMFLDNVVHDRALVIKPWQAFNMHGNSLFLWRIGFGVVITLLGLPLLLLGFFRIVLLSKGPVTPAGIIWIVMIAIVGFLGSVLVSYISLFANSFVVPIMYKHNIRILEAWRKFIPILKSHFIHFILYGLFIFLIGIVIIAAVLITGCLTCCVGYIVLMIPYINAVCLLPVYVTLRAFSLEFLAQWGPDYSVFPVEAAPSDQIPPPIPPPAGAEA